MKRSRETLVLVVFLALLAGGLVADQTSDGVEPASDRGAAETIFVERAEYCPPGLRTAKVVSRLAAASPQGAAVPVGLQPALPQPIRLGAGKLLLRRRTSSTGIDVVGYGATVLAGSLSEYEKPARGATAMRCAPDASATWYFAEGSSEIGYDERILLYNPFPAEAVVRVTLFTPKGPQAKANLDEIPVHEGSATAITLNDFVKAQPVLGVSVEATRGRLVAWRVLIPPRTQAGVSGSLGVDAPSTTWYFPNGEVGSGVREQISILNPTREEAMMTVSFVSRKGVVQPPKLVDFAIRPRTVKQLVVPDYLKESELDLGAISAVIVSKNDVPVVAEQTLVYSSGNLQGMASELGARAPAEHWALPPASARPTSESIAVFNPGTEKAVVGITLIRTDGPPKQPDALQDVELEPGARIKLPVGEYTKGAPMAAFVDATGPVTVARFAYSASDADVSAIGGERVRRADRRP